MSIRPGAVEAFGYRDVSRSPVVDWLDGIFTVSSMKDDDKSKELREKGNDLYKCKRFDDALEAYTESVVYATEDGEEMTLAYANRSAVLYSMNEFENCLADIENSLRTNYPERLLYKVYIRQANCYFRLNRREDVIQTVLKIRNCLNNLEQSKIGEGGGEVAGVLF